MASADDNDNDNHDDNHNHDDGAHAGANGVPDAIPNTYADTTDAGTPCLEHTRWLAPAHAPMSGKRVPRRPADGRVV